ncbi:hypothetical protein QJS66_14110 [Kocuria rhizophila]|nr:hypothetical protein QJS66_14110 [Kocuria rhizophila]
MMEREREAEKLGTRASLMGACSGRCRGKRPSPRCCAVPGFDAVVAGRERAADRMRASG